MFNIDLLGRLKLLLKSIQGGPKRKPQPNHQLILSKPAN